VSKYVWRESGPKPPISAEVFGETLERLAGPGKSIQVVTPAAIVAEARKPDSPIHKGWNWNVRHAAELHWLEQARHYAGALQIVRVEVKSGPNVSTKALFSVRVNGQRGYATQERIRSSRDLTRQVIEDAKRELEIYIAKFAGIATFGKFVPRLQSVIDDMQSELDRLVVDATARKTRRKAGYAEATQDQG
jgi:hypothetical protein